MKKLLSMTLLILTSSLAYALPSQEIFVKPFTMTEGDKMVYYSAFTVDPSTETPANPVYGMNIIAMQESVADELSKLTPNVAVKCEAHSWANVGKMYVYSLTHCR
jgi:hypothetical protein